MTRYNMAVLLLVVMASVLLICTSRADVTTLQFGDVWHKGGVNTFKLDFDQDISPGSSLSFLTTTKCDKTGTPFAARSHLLSAAMNDLLAVPSFDTINSGYEVGTPCISQVDGLLSTAVVKFRAMSCDFTLTFPHGLPQDTLLTCHFKVSDASHLVALNYTVHHTANDTALVIANDQGVGLVQPFTDLWNKTIHSFGTTEVTTRPPTGPISHISTEPVWYDITFTNTTLPPHGAFAVRVKQAGAWYPTLTTPNVDLTNAFCGADVRLFSAPLYSWETAGDGMFNRLFILTGEQPAKAFTCKIPVLLTGASQAVEFNLFDYVSPIHDTALPSWARAPIHTITVPGSSNITITPPALLLDATEATIGEVLDTDTWTRAVTKSYTYHHIAGSGDEIVVKLADELDYGFQTAQELLLNWNNASINSFFQVTIDGTPYNITNATTTEQRTVSHVMVKDESAGNKAITITIALSVTFLRSGDGYHLGMTPFALPITVQGIVAPHPLAHAPEMVLFQSVFTMTNATHVAFDTYHLFNAVIPTSGGMPIGTHLRSGNRIPGTTGVTRPYVVMMSTPGQFFNETQPPVCTATTVDYPRRAVNVTAFRPADETVFFLKDGAAPPIGADYFVQMDLVDMWYWDQIKLSCIAGLNQHVARGAVNDMKIHMAMPQNIWYTRSSWTTAAFGTMREDYEVMAGWQATADVGMGYHYAMWGAKNSPGLANPAAVRAAVVKALNAANTTATFTTDDVVILAANIHHPGPQPADIHDVAIPFDFIDFPTAATGVGSFEQKVMNTKTADVAFFKIFIATTDFATANCTHRPLPVDGDEDGLAFRYIACGGEISAEPLYKEKFLHSLEDVSFAAPSTLDAPYGAPCTLHAQCMGGSNQGVCSKKTKTCVKPDGVEYFSQVARHNNLRIQGVGLDRYTKSTTYPANWNKPPVPDGGDNNGGGGDNGGGNNGGGGSGSNAAFAPSAINMVIAVVVAIVAYAMI